MGISGVKSLVIIGGGAAGLMAANSALRLFDNRAFNITVIEKNERPARKVMITGKGRCNVTNNCDVNTLIQNTVTNARFLYSAYNRFSPQDTMAFFENAGVPLKTERGNRVFPVSDKAVSIVDGLFEAVNKNCRIINTAAEQIVLNNGCVSSVLLKDGTVIPADAVILCTGGKSYPLTGSTGDGYIMAQKAGHTVIDTRPSLTGLECHEGFCSKLSGLSLKNVTLSLFCEGNKKPIFTELGELLFTHTGISGPLTLSASAHIRNPRENEYTAVIDLKPALDCETLSRRILRDFEQQLNKDFSNSLDMLLPKSLIPVIVARTGIPPDQKVNGITKEMRENLVHLIKNFTLHITDYGPMEEAVVTGGGISVKEVSPKTMESKLVNGLYFAGEILDVDALTGGFNLQIAFSTGFVAGESAAKKLTGELL